MRMERREEKYNVCIFLKRTFLGARFLLSFARGGKAHFCVTPQIPSAKNHRRACTNDNVLICERSASTKILGEFPTNNIGVQIEEIKKKKKN